MKAIEQKKLAIIKSNAAPEVKLKALEKLNSKETEAIAKYASMIIDAQDSLTKAMAYYGLLEMHAVITKDPQLGQLGKKIAGSLNIASRELKAALQASKELSSKYKG